jgi:hypothetical protein
MQRMASNRQQQAEHEENVVRRIIREQVQASIISSQEVVHDYFQSSVGQAAAQHAIMEILMSMMSRRSQ